MSSKDIVAGDYVGKPFSARMVESKGGTIGMEVAFRFEVGGSMETIYRQFWLSEAAEKYSYDAFVLMGFSGNPTDKSPFDGREVKLVIDLEEGEETDKNTGEVRKTGKFYPRVKYVNALGGAGFKEVEPAKVQVVLKKINFDGKFLSAQDRAGVKPSVSKSEPLAKFTDDDVPF